MNEIMTENVNGGQNGKRKRMVTEKAHGAPFPRERRTGPGCTQPKMERRRYSQRPEILKPSVGKKCAGNKKSLRCSPAWSFHPKGFLRIIWRIGFCGLKRMTQNAVTRHSPGSSAHSRRRELLETAFNNSLVSYSSPGGSVNAGLVIYYLIQSCRFPVNIYGTGMAYRGY